MIRLYLSCLALLIAVGLLFAIAFNKHTKRSYVKSGPIRKVLILGNSIVRHPPLPEIGWNNNWGMAASSMDSDFAHILIRNIKAKDNTCQVMYENIADFEAGYKDWDFSRADRFTRFNPEIIIMRIAENVNDQNAEKNDFITYYDKLINRIDTGHHAMIFICNGWWQNKHVNELLHDYAAENGYPFIDQTRLYSPATIALGQYKNQDVQQHPNNRGMQKIAESIWSEIGKYFE